MKGYWKTKNKIKHFIKDNIKYWTKHDTFIYEKNFSHTYDDTLKINERFISWSIPKHLEFLITIQIPLNKENTKQQTFTFVAYKLNYIDSTTLYDYYFSKFNGRDHTNYEYELKCKLTDLSDIWNSPKYTNVGSFFHWRNWNYDIKIISIKPLLTFTCEIETLFFTQTTWLPNYLMYKTFIDVLEDNKFKSIKIPQYLIKPKPNKYEKESIYKRQDTHKIKTSQHIYSNKELRDFKLKNK